MKRLTWTAVMIVLCGGVAAHAQLRGRGTTNKAPAPAVQTDVPVTEPNKDFPLRLHFLDGEGTSLNGSAVGVGSGNLLGDKGVGFDYTFQCDQGFTRPDEPDAFYQGRWKKQDKVIEILTKEPYSDKTHKCKLDVGMRTAPYTDENKPPPLPSVPRQGRKKKN